MVSTKKEIEVKVYNEKKEVVRVFKGERAKKVATAWAAERGYTVKK